MAKKRAARAANSTTGAGRVSSSVEELLLSAVQRGDDSHQTGRFLITYKEQAGTEGPASLKAKGMRVADARDFAGQAATVEDVGDADALVFPEIGVALVGGDAATARGMTVAAEVASDDPVESIDPEYFVFA
jgi:subtilisin